MAPAIDPLMLEKALETLDAKKRQKADVSRLRYENRLLRLSRRKLELENKRAQQATNPIARALAKAKILAGTPEN